MPWQNFGVRRPRRKLGRASGGPAVGGQEGQERRRPVVSLREPERGDFPYAFSRDQGWGSRRSPAVTVFVACSRSPSCEGSCMMARSPASVPAQGCLLRPRGSRERALRPPPVFTLNRRSAQEQLLSAANRGPQSCSHTACKLPGCCAQCVGGDREDQGELGVPNFVFRPDSDICPFPPLATCRRVDSTAC